MRKKNLYAKAAALFLASAILLSSMLCGCGNTAKTTASALPNVKLSIWCNESSVELLNGMIDDFVAANSDKAVFDITVSEEGELTCKETVLANPASAADVYTFADDQFQELWNTGALLEIEENAGEIIASVGGIDSGAAKSAVRGGKLFAIPETAGNGYFLYYNSDYFSQDDIKSLDRILEVCEKNGKKFCMDFSSGWYIYSFFKGAGLELQCTDDGSSNICNWNAVDTKYKGTDVSEAMLRIASNGGFISCDDDSFLKGVQDGSIIAGVNGAWNAETLKKSYGDGYSAAALPTFTLAGDSVQMCSFTGYKLVGVNRYTQNPEWAVKLAEWITNEENQLRRFNAIGECPANINAAQSDEVQSSVAIAALSEQSRYGFTQSVADTFWNPSRLFGTTMASGNADNKELQELLDAMVEGIVSKPQ